MAVGKQQTRSTSERQLIYNRRRCSGSRRGFFRISNITSPRHTKKAAGKLYFCACLLSLWVSGEERQKCHNLKELRCSMFPVGSRGSLLPADDKFIRHEPSLRFAIIWALQTPKKQVRREKTRPKDPDYIAVRLNGSMRSMRTGLARLILLYRCRSACIIPCRTTLPTGRSISIGNVRLKQKRADGCRKTERITDRRQKGPANISTGQAASKKTCPWTGNQLAYASL